MRIIGGEYGGRKLISPKGKNIRPTTDRMRETIFNILNHSSVRLEGANILDVFAGSGAMGLECLSRGAKHATFFDKDRSALQLVKKNITLLAAHDKSFVKFVTAPDLPPAKMHYDIIFLDPPYIIDIIADTISVLKKKNYCADNCMIIAEYDPTKELITPDYMEIIKEKTYGYARFSFLKYIPK